MLQLSVATEYKYCFFLFPFPLDVFLITKIELDWCTSQVFAHFQAPWVEGWASSRCSNPQLLSPAVSLAQVGELSSTHWDQ